MSTQLNLAQQFNFFYQLQGYPDTAKFTTAFVIDLLDDAERQVNKEVPTIYSTATFDSTDDTRTYSIATNFSDILDWNIIAVWYSISDSTKIDFMYPTSENYLDTNLGTDSRWRTNGTGNPSHWYLLKKSNEIGFYPYEKTVSTGTNCIQVEYFKKHTKMTTYYTTGTLSISNGSTSVTGSGTTWTGNVAAGDAIGVGSLLSSTAFPTTWYTIASVDSNTGITLTGAYSGTASGASYIICSKSTILNEDLNKAAVYLAIAQSKLKSKEKGEYSNYRTLAFELMRAHKEKLDSTNYAIFPYETEYNDFVSEGINY